MTAKEIKTTGMQAFNIPVDDPDREEFLRLAHKFLNKQSSFKLRTRGRGPESGKDGSCPMDKAEWLAIYIENPVHGNLTELKSLREARDYFADKVTELRKALQKSQEYSSFLEASSEKLAKDVARLKSDLTHQTKRLNQTNDKLNRMTEKWHIANNEKLEWRGRFDSAFKIISNLSEALNAQI